MTILFAVPFVIVTAAGMDAGKAPAPNAAVAAMRSVLVAGEFNAFYNVHCHKHLRDQVDEKEFVEAMRGKRGEAIVNLFVEVDDALKGGKGEQVVIARSQEEPDEYEFILVQVKRSPSRKGQQWHLELKKEDGKWKLQDTD